MPAKFLALWFLCLFYGTDNSVYIIAPETVVPLKMCIGHGITCPPNVEIMLLSVLSYYWCVTALVLQLWQ